MKYRSLFSIVVAAAPAFGLYGCANVLEGGLAQKVMMSVAGTQDNFKAEWTAENSSGFFQARLSRHQQRAAPRERNPGWKG